MLTEQRDRRMGRARVAHVDHRQVAGMPKRPTVRCASLAIVLPTYNEAARIGPALDNLFSYLQGRGASADLPERIEVLVVDNGSTDDTVALVNARSEAVRSEDATRQLRVLSTNQPGKGAAIRAGMLHAQADLVIFADADMAAPPDQIPLLVAALADHDVALGSRIQPDGSDMRKSQPLYRRMLGKAFHELASVWVGDVQDTQCGFKGFTRAAAHDLFARQRIDSIVFDVEVIYLAKKRGYRLAIVPIIWADQSGSRMRAVPSLALRVILDLLRIPVLHWGVVRAEPRLS
jgi:dolichyl-phosphate beta-glucosyltransferase